MGGHKTLPSPLATVLLTSLLWTSVPDSGTLAPVLDLLALSHSRAPLTAAQGSPTWLPCALFPSYHCLHTPLPNLACAWLLSPISCFTLTSDTSAYLILCVGFYSFCPLSLVSTMGLLDPLAQTIGLRLTLSIVTLSLAAGPKVLQALGF